MVRLNYNDLMEMDGQKVFVIESEFNFKCKCIVEVKSIWDVDTNEKWETIELNNDIYSFRYDRDGNCKYNEFKVYRIEEPKWST